MAISDIQVSTLPGANARLGLSASAPLPKNANVQFPTQDPSRSIPYIAGTVELSPQVIWWGDYKKRGVHADFLQFFTSLAADPNNQRYFIGMALGLCYGPGVTIKAIKITDHTVWAGSQSGGSLTVYAPGEFGDGTGYGVYAVCDHLPGSMTQLRNSYLNSQLPNVPAFRGVSVLVWRGPSSGSASMGKIKYSGYIGRSPAAREMKVRAARFPSPLGSGFETVNTNHANFAEVIYELLTNQTVGLGIASALIDGDAFVAAAETLYNESLGCSFKWEQPAQFIDMLTRLLETIDATLFTSLETGKITLKLIRADYNIDDLVHVDETQTGIELELNRADVNSSVGEVNIPFVDVENNFVDATARAQSLSNRNQPGPVPTTLERLGLGDATAANKVATRELRALAIPLDRGTLKVNREAYSFTVGQPFVLSWAPYELEEKVFRVLEIDYGTLDDGKISLTIVEDPAGTAQQQLGIVVSNQWHPPVVVTPVDDASNEVKSITTAAPPGSPTLGDRYVVPAGASGVWSGHTNDVATWNGTAWIFETANDDLKHTVVFNAADSKHYRWNGTAWIEVVLSSYNTIQDEGAALVPREILNFIGAGVTAADDPDNQRTNVTITRGSARLLFEFGDGKDASSLAVDQTSRFPDLIAGTITKVRIEGDAAGSAVVDIQTATDDPPTYASICASAKPTLSTDVFAEDITLTGWTTAIAEGTKAKAVLQSVSALKQVAVVLTIQRS